MLLLLNKIERFLSSRKLSIALLAVFLALCVIGTVIPQEGVEPSRTIHRWKSDHPQLAFLGTTRLFSTWYFSAVMGCIFITITFNAGKLIRRTRKTCAEEAAVPDPGVVSRMKSKMTVPTTVDVGTLKRSIPFTKFSTNAEGTIIRGERFRFARWTMVGFHLSLIVIIGSVFLNRAMFYRAVYSLVERDYFIAGKDKPASAEKGFLALSEILPIKVTLTGIQDSYAEEGYQPSLASEIKIEVPAGTSNVLVTRAEPVDVDGLTIYQSPEYGYAPVFTKLAPDGRAVTGTVRMARQDREEDPAVAIYLGSGMVPQSGLRLECSCTTLPVSAGIPGRIMVRFISESGVRYQGEMAAGSEVRIGHDLIRLEGILFWTDLIVVRQPWIALLYIGFIGAFFSLLAFAAFQPCVIYGLVERARGTTTIAVSCARFKSSEEFILRRLTANVEARRRLSPCTADKLTFN